MNLWKSSWVWGIVLASLLVPAAGMASGVRTVTGLAHLERRATIVPLILCQTPDGAAQPCYLSKPYWVLVIEQNGVSYQLDEEFALGSAKVPPYVELEIDQRLVQVRSGDRVTVRGDVETVNGDYAMIRTISDFSVEPSSVVGLAQSSALSVPQTLLWQCRPIERVHRDLLIEVWQSNEKSLNNYVLQVKKAGDPIARAERPDFEVLPDQIIFHSDNAARELELILNQRSPEFESASGVFQLWNTGNAAAGSEGIVSQVECNRSLDTTF